MPLVEPRSTISQSPVELRRSSACFRETFGSARTQSHSRERPERGDRAVEDEAAIVERDDRLRLGQMRHALGRARLALGLRRHLVDHRVSLLALRRRLTLALRGLDQAGLDAELAEAQALVNLQAHLGPGQQRQVVAARVLQEVRRRAPARASARSPRGARGPPCRARRCTGWARRRARPRRCGARPSPWRASARSRPAGPARRRRARTHPEPGSQSVLRGFEGRLCRFSLRHASRAGGSASCGPR